MLVRVIRYEIFACMYGVYVCLHHFAGVKGTVYLLIPDSCNAFVLSRTHPSTEYSNRRFQTHGNFRVIRWSSLSQLRLFVLITLIRPSYSSVESQTLLISALRTVSVVCRTVNIGGIRTVVSFD